MIVDKKGLVAKVKAAGGRASMSMTNTALVREANRCGLGARKASRAAARKAGIEKVASPSKKRRRSRRPKNERAFYSNPGPDPYRKDILVLDPGGISPAGPFGPFGDREWVRKAPRSNPGGLPYPGQVVGMGDYLLIDNAAPAPMAENPMGDYLLLDDAPSTKNPGKRKTGLWTCPHCGKRLAQGRSNKIKKHYHPQGGVCPISGLYRKH